jgi:hypothetical protein
VIVLPGVDGVPQRRDGREASKDDAGIVHRRGRDGDRRGYEVTMTHRVEAGGDDSRMQKRMMENAIQTTVTVFYDGQTGSEHAIDSTHDEEPHFTQREGRASDHLSAPDQRAEHGIGVRASEADGGDCVVGVSYVSLPLTDGTGRTSRECVERCAGPEVDEPQQGTHNSGEDQPVERDAKARVDLFPPLRARDSTVARERPCAAGSGGEGADRCERPDPKYW